MFVLQGCLMVIHISLPGFTDKSIYQNLKVETSVACLQYASLGHG